MLASINIIRNNYQSSQLIFKILDRRYSNSSLTKIICENGVKNIILSDPKTRNSLSECMMAELIEKINEDRDNKDVRCIVLSAEGNIFSAGHNLKELYLGNDSERVCKIQAVFNTATKLMNSIIDSPLPIIAKVDGLAAAAGCQLVAQCDIAVCSDKSTFSTPGINFGIFCSTPGIALARSVHRKTLVRMLFTGKPIDSHEAKMSGLVSVVCKAEDLDKEVKSICNDIKSKSRKLVTLGKQFYYRQSEMELKQAYEEGCKWMTDNVLMEEGQEGVLSFMEKRKPSWKE